MATLNGWLNNLYGSEESREILEELNENGIFSNIASMNGNVACQFYISHNHLGSSFNYFFEKLEKLVTIEHNELQGLIYLYDDEDPKFYDTWQVWKIHKGEIENTTDTFLSPISEKVFIYDDE